MPKAKSKPTKTKVAVSSKKVLKKPVKRSVKKITKKTVASTVNPIIAEIAREERSYHFLYTLFVLFLLSFGVFVYYFLMK